MSSSVVEHAHPFAAATKAGRLPYKVAALSHASQGRNEIRLAEQEMPGLMALRREHSGQQPLAGAKVMGSLHMTIQTAVLIETLAELGADVRWASCNIFSTQDHAAAAVAVGRPGTGGTVDDLGGSRCSRGKGETLSEYWWCTNEALVWPDGTGPDLIVDDGGDATLFVHKGYAFEKAGTVPAFNPDQDPEEWGVILDLLREIQGRDKTQWHRISLAIRGVSEETTTGCPSALRDDAGRLALVPGHQRQRFGHQEQVRQRVRVSPFPARRVGAGDRRHARRQSGGGLWLRRSWQGVRAVTPRPGVPGGHYRGRPDLCPTGRHGRVRGQDARHHARNRLMSSSPRPAIARSSPAEQMGRMKDKAIVGNIGHFDNEIDMAGLQEDPGNRAAQHQAAVRRVAFFPMVTVCSCSPKDGC